MFTDKGSGEDLYHSSSSYSNSDQAQHNPLSIFPDQAAIMLLPSTSQAVAIVAMASTAAALAAPGPEAVANAEAFVEKLVVREADANSQAPATTAQAPTYTLPDICGNLNTTDPLQSTLYSRNCVKETRTGTATLSGQIPVSTYVTRYHRFDPKVTETVYSWVPTGTKVAVCTRVGANNRWVEVDENFARVSGSVKCPWDLSRPQFNVCSVM